MPLKGKLAKVFLCLALSIAAFSGAPMDREQIKENLRIMNQTRVEVVVPEKNGEPNPDYLLPPDPK